MRVAAVFAVLSAFCLAATGRAQTTPDVLIAGQVRSALAYGSAGWCAVTQGSSAIQRNHTASIAVISFPELTFFDDGTYYLLNGQAQLHFTSATAGVIHFQETGLSSTISSPAFDRFVERYNGAQYVIGFSIEFPGCTLPISAEFEAP